MFNHHFFGDNSNGKILYESALKREKSVILVDPPFGGLVEVLVHTLSLINKDWRRLNDCKGKSL